MQYDWDKHNEDHVSDHKLAPEDVEEALEDPDLIVTDAYNTPTERRYAVLGKTVGGYILFITYTMRGEKYRVVTARDADKGEKRYRRQK